MTEEKWFKAKAPEDRSGDIVVSFSHEWFRRIADRKINGIFRRRVPRSVVPKRLYIYLGKPASALVGFANVSKLLIVNLDEALRLAKPSGLTDSDIRDYLDGHEKIGYYQIGNIYILDEAIPLKDLRELAGFSPPQSFVFLSKKAANWLHGHSSAPSDLRTTLASHLVEDGAEV